MNSDPISPKTSAVSKQLDWIVTVVPFIYILVLCALFMALPESSTKRWTPSASFWGPVRQLLPDPGPGAFICSLYMAFSRYGKIRLGSSRPAAVLRVQLGLHDVHRRAGGRHPVLLPLRVDSLRRGTPHHGHGLHAGLGQHLPLIPLGAHSLELLHDPGGILRLHDPCAPPQQAKSTLKPAARSLESAWTAPGAR